ncbi:hypothetical protein ACFTAO_00190 [Paenibacillus rhizoplanae]
MTIFWIRNRNDFADFTEHMDSAWSSGLIMVDKPTTFGAAEACGSDMVEKNRLQWRCRKHFCSFLILPLLNSGAGGMIVEKRSGRLCIRIFTD